MRRLVVLLTLLALSSAPLGAQSSTAGQEVNGQITVQVNATLGDGSNDYNPLPGLPLTLYRGATDSLELRTDDAGVLRFAIKPGTYRISSAPVPFRGRTYRWNVPLTVERGMQVLQLTAQNASVSGPTTTAARGTPIDDAGSSPSAPYDRKSGTVATLLSVLVTGGGQMYAGKVNKGLGLLALGLAGGVVTVVSLNEYDKNDYPGVDNTAGTAGIIAGVTISLGSFIYSLATANGDVREYNAARHPIALRPTLDLQRGRTGFAISYMYGQ